MGQLLEADQTKLTPIIVGGVYKYFFFKLLKITHTHTTFQKSSLDSYKYLTECEGYNLNVKSDGMVLQLP